jgi:hypothetical protein
MQRLLIYLSLLLFVAGLFLPAVDLDPWLPGLNAFFLCFIGAFIGFSASTWHWITSLLGAATNILLLAAGILLWRRRTRGARSAAFTAVIFSLLVLPALNGIHAAGFGMVSVGYWLWVGSALLLAIASLLRPRVAAESPDRQAAWKPPTPPGGPAAGVAAVDQTVRPRTSYPKLTVGLGCIALGLTAWAFKAEPVMGLGLAGIAIVGTIMEFVWKRPAKAGAALTPTTTRRPAGAGFLKEWLTRDHQFTRYHQALLWWVALPLVVWWPTRFQLLDAVAENRRAKVGLCLALGCDVNAAVKVIPHAWYLGTPGVRTPLFEAIRSSNVPMVMFLLRHGADPNLYCGEPNAVNSPINLTQQPEIVEALREAIAATREKRRP